MEDEYQYPLFFEARDLTDRERGRVTRHFQKRKDSGGGDCLTIAKAGAKTYKVCFKEKEDQERVLQRKFHTIPLADGELRLTVSRTDSSQTFDQPSTSQSQTFTKPNTKTLEKIFKPDLFLLFYLRDNLKANKLLKKQLSVIGCTVEFDLDEEWAVVKGDVDKGSGGAFVSDAENWELQVDKVFISLTESYLCYHVVEPKQAKILMQDLTFVTDDIKVYTESGYPVVVGENDAVKDRIAILEKSLPTRKELPIAERQFKVVEEEFNREICTHCPEVKIHRSNATIILEGPDKEVKSGATKLDELIRKVKEKRVKLPTAILTFMTSSGAISKYQARFQQSLRNPVLIEVGSDLVLSSLSSDALDEAEAALQRDLSLDNVQLHGAAAVPPDLDRVKEILMKEKNEANLRELRVDISFIPGPSGAAVTKVQLVGYSENVNKLKELLHNYQMNQIGTQELLSLPHPELVDCFPDVLQMIGMKHNKVTLEASHIPYPSVLVSGPRCLVQEVQAQLNATLASLTKDTLVLDGPARRYFQEEGKMNKEQLESSCQVIIREQQGVSGTTSSPVTTTLTPRLSMTRPSYNTTGSSAVNKTSLEIKLGNLSDEQVNVLVAPMINGKLASTNIGSCLIKKAGNAINSKFNSAAANRTFAPGDVLQVDAPPSLGCSKLFFIECSPWDGVRGQSMQALGKGLKTCLDLCVQQRVCSVAFPIIGPGILLKYPLRVAIEVLTENIRLFGLSASTGSLSSIHIVIKPGYPDTEECYHDVHKHLSSSINQGGRAIFKSLTSDLDDITMTLGGGVKLQLVFGDITNEVTAVVVNTTDFANFQNDGVCKDILTVAGPEVEAELRAANVKQGEIFVSESGSFPCDALLHVCGQKDAGIIEQLVCDIIRHCENYRFKSVAIPAICAGAGGLDPGVVAGAILRGVKAATSSASLHSVTNIRLVLIKIDVFLAFKEEATQMFPTAVINRVSVPQRLHVQQQQPPSLSVSTDLSILHSTSTSQKSVFLFLGLSRKDVDDAMTKLKGAYQAQCSTQTFRNEELAGLTQDDLEDLRQLVELHGLNIQRDQSGPGSLTVSGFKDGVNQVAKKINDCLHESLRREVRAREEEELFSRVVWCILGNNGNWERLPKTANYKLEKNDIAEGIVDARGAEWSVDVQRLEASTRVSGQTTKLKRLENLPDFTLPLEWDNMASGEPFKAVPLQPSSAEYKSVKEAFKRTVSKTVMKVERLQSVHLRRAYEVQKKHISDNRRQEGGACEKFLYHGTTQENCDSIMKTGFNRRFAGQNATMYGHGTYFAVNANYSAQPTYSKPAADGSQLMFVARVLTGVYTQGSNDMMVPPPRSNSQPHDRCDSVVDKIDNPSMYVVFHDNQAYPDYLITFK